MGLEAHVCWNCNILYGVRGTHGVYGDYGVHGIRRQCYHQAYISNIITQHSTRERASETSLGSKASETSMMTRSKGLDHA